MKNIKYKIPDITNLATTSSLNAKINEVKGKIPNFTNLVTTTSSLFSVEIKIPTVSNLIKKLTITQKVMKLKIITNHAVMINILLLQNLID